MLINYIKIAFRNILKHKGYSAVNILGLSVGLTCVIIISMIIRNELSFDKFNKNADRIYRVYVEGKQGDNIVETAPVMIPFAPAAQSEIPEIQYAVRISNTSLLSSYNDKKFYESACYVDDKFFDVFSFPFIKGDKETALNEPNKIVISQRIADKYFGNENPIGKSLKFNNKDFFQITGVIKNLPDNSHLRGDIFISFASLNESNFPRLHDWGSFSNDYTYLLLKKNVNPASVEQKLQSVIISNTEGDYQNRVKMKMQPLAAIHFSNLIHDDARTTPVIFLFVFAAIAIFILLIACINFINLTTARAARRNKEIGIRKVVGANRAQLIKQFMSESFVITLISFLTACFLSVSVISEVNQIMKQNFPVSILYDFSFMLVMIGILIITSVASGAYPAFILSRARPAAVLKNAGKIKKSGYSLRAALVVLQFAISVFLIIGTITVYKQTDFLLSKDLGFPSDRIVVLRNNDKNIRESGTALKNSLLQNQNILSASFSSGTPGSNSSRTSNFTPEGGSEKDEVICQIIDVDYDFLKTYDLKITSGRFFSREFSTDSSDAYILNETAAKKFGWQNVLGHQITIGGGGDDSKFCTIIGVMQDFNYSSLKNNISPTIFRLNIKGGNFLSLQLKTENVASTIDFIKNTNAEFSPSYPFDFFFIKESFEKYYNGVSTMGKLLGGFSLLAIMISCVGILGLVSFSTEQKSKEIGVRKVLGASVGSIVVMLCKEFIKWVLIANIIMWPLAYLAMNSFLSSFAYRTNLGYMIFAVTLLVSLLITIITVSFHSVKAAIANPVVALRYE